MKRHENTIVNEINASYFIFVSILSVISVSCTVVCRYFIADVPCLGAARLFLGYWRLVFLQLFNVGQFRLLFLCFSL